MRAYTPRRQSKRWLDADCPKGVLAVYDNGGKTADRYTVFYTGFVDGDNSLNGWLSYRAMSSNPFHPCGVGIYSELEAYKVADYRYRFRHQACRWSSLTEAVKQLVRADLTD